MLLHQLREPSLLRRLPFLLRLPFFIEQGQELRQAIFAFRTSFDNSFLSSFRKPLLTSFFQCVFHIRIRQHLRKH